MSEFYLFSAKCAFAPPPPCPEPKTSWLPFSSSVAKAAVAQRFDSPLGSRAPGRRGSQDEEAFLPAGKQFIFPTAGLHVAPTVREVAGIVRVSPAVHTTPDAAVVFFGYLSNLEDLLGGPFAGAGRSSFDSDASPVSPRLAALRAEPFGAAFDADSSLAAEVVLALYQSHNSSSDALIMLSQLQGQYAFAIYDSHRKQVFAARDPSGSEPLFMHVDDDDGVSFTNAPFDAPAGPRMRDWQPVPAGHFVFGKGAKLQQFALTPEQLYQREVWQSNMESESSLGRGSSVTRTCSDSARSSADTSHLAGLYGISL